MQVPVTIGHTYMLTPKVRNVVSWIPATSVAQSQGTSCTLQRKTFESSNCLEETLDTFLLNSEWRLLGLASNPDVLPSSSSFPAPPPPYSLLVFIPSRSKAE